MGVDRPFRELDGVGLDFVHQNGMTGEYYFCEMVGAGGALFDYDNDGDLDLLLLQGGPLRGPQARDAQVTGRVAPSPSHRLLQNRLSEDGSLRFEDVTSRSGAIGAGYGMGVAAGDYDNDGFVDLYLTHFGANRLLHNNGDGTFTDETTASGTEDDRWSTSAAFLDYDQDGHLDLFVCNYVDFSLRNHKECYSESSARDYCGPLSYSPVPDKLLRNRGDGTFEDVTARARVSTAYGGALGVVCCDLNRDGWIDLYVANDGLPNQCWINQGDGTYQDDSLLGGCAFNENGKAEASMGVDAADFDGDGDEDLFMTHLTTETNTYYRNDGRGFFTDATVSVGLGQPSRVFTGFGTAGFDYDNDGWLDLFVANGAVKTIEALARAGDPFPLHQRNQLFRNAGEGRFVEVSPEGDPALARSEVSRGALFGDLDNDGDTDVVVCNNHGPARLLLNEIGNQSHWLGVRVLDSKSIRDQHGALVEVVVSTDKSLWRRVRTDASYCAANDPRVLVGLGERDGVQAVRVHWPDRSVEEWKTTQVDRYLVLARGTGQVRP